MIALLLVLILIALIAPSLLRLIAVLIGFALLYMLVSISAHACVPAPSCWMASSPEYLRDVCRGYAKDHKTLKEIENYVEEPGKVPDFGRACKKLGVPIQPGTAPAAVRDTDPADCDAPILQLKSERCLAPIRGPRP